MKKRLAEIKNEFEYAYHWANVAAVCSHFCDYIAVLEDRIEKLEKFQADVDGMQGGAMRRDHGTRKATNNSESTS